MSCSRKTVAKGMRMLRKSGVSQGTSGKMRAAVYRNASSGGTASKPIARKTAAASLKSALNQRRGV